MFRALLFLFVASAFAFAQEEGGDDDSGISIDGGGQEGSIDIDVDPFDPPVATDEPNRPPAVEVGTWQPPELDDAARHEMEALQGRRGEAPDDVSLRYQLAEFYLARGWLPQAEGEFLACGTLDPESVRPWEGLLRVYAVAPARPDREAILRNLLAGGDAGDLDVRDWLRPEDRTSRTTRAWREIVRRRPDDVARRREFLAHLKGAGDVAGIEGEAREILARLPADADTRFDLAEAVRRRGAAEEGARKGAAAEALAAARDLLQENLRGAPGHAASALRLARILAKLEGDSAAERIGPLEERGFFHLFARAELMPVEFRPDTLRMARDLAGPQLAGRLWDSALRPPRAEDPLAFLVGEEAPMHVQRWICIHFPNPRPDDQKAVLERLARRGDRDAAGILLAFLWHLEAEERYEETQLNVRADLRAVEAAAVEAAARLGAAIYPGAERLLKAATEPQHRRRAAGLLRKLRDPRAVAPLAAALAWDVREDASYGIAAALEELGDAGAVAALADAALDQGRPVARRRDAAEALAAFQDARAVEAVNRLAKEPALELVTAYGLFRLTGDEAALRKLREALRGPEDPAEVVRLLRKCEGPRVEEALLAGLEDAPPAAHPHIMALLRERYWSTALPRVKTYLLKQARAADCPDEVIDLLGDLGGPEASDRLLAIVESAQGVRWARAARALARTGDARGVRYFSRLRIVDTDPGRRNLAAELYESASARRAQLDRADK
jgi:hypothetical protein